MSSRILVVEDEESIRELIQITLESYSYEVCAFETAEEGLAYLSANPVHLILLDLMLPGMDGVEATRRIRSQSKYDAVPVLMLTAKDTEVDKVVGLDAGADDYITKPFSVLELAARVRSSLRRYQRNAGTAGEILVGELLLKTDTREVLLKGEPVKLTFKEYELLKYLMENRARVVTREELLDHIWGINFVGETRTLDMHILSLRQKLKDEQTKHIKTIRGVGYRFTEPA